MISQIRLLLAPVLIFWLSDVSAGIGEALALDDVRIVDTAGGQVTTGRCVRIQGNRIVAVTEAGSRRCRINARIVELAGLYVMPGLIDTHAHLTLGPVEMRRERGKMVMAAEASDEIADHNARRLVAFGVTTIRNPGGDLAAAARYKGRRAAGEVIGPESFDAGKVIHNTAIPGLAEAVRDADGMRRVVADQAAAGADWIKLYTGLSPDLLQAGIDAAHDHDLPAVAHLERIAWPDALAMGLDGIVHLMPTSPDLLDDESRQAWHSNARPGTFAFFEWWEHFDPDGSGADRLVASFEQHRPVFDATLVAFHAAFVQDLDNAYKEDTRRLAHPRLRANWEDWFTFAVGWQADDFERARAIWPKVQRLAERVYNSGARVTIGTDMNNPWIAPGISLHREMALLAEAGVPVDRILAAATVNAAEALGANDRLGHIAEGFEADLVVLDANPLEDISHTRAIHAVVSDGRWLDANRLAELAEPAAEENDQKENDHAQ
ncbi:MAG TPA: amidohydrolase family protein [Wenzhouxiangellaceae bacterium]|nr:amidohydrolase family protein [Wenzhouxiangellaceae bacterium]